MSRSTAIIDEALLRASTPSIRVEPARSAPPPSAPLAVARAFVQSVFTTPAGLLLRHHRDNLYLWNGPYYAEIDKRDIRSAAYRWLEHAEYLNGEGMRVSWSPTRRKIDDVFDATRAVALVDSRLEAPTWLETHDPDRRNARATTAMANGLLHVPTRTMHPHTPEFFCVHGLPFAFDPNPPPPQRWLALLNQLWPEDTNSIDVLQEVFGYLLAGATGLQKIFLLVGPPRSGKGTIGRVLTGLLGPHNVAAPTLSGLATNFGLAPLVGKPLAIIEPPRVCRRAINVS